MLGSLSGKSLLMTGAGSGIGAAAAKLAAAAGAMVTVTDVADDHGNAVVAEIRAAGGTAQFVHADIADVGQVAAMVVAAVAAYGRLDGAFNNAAIPGYSHRPGGTFTLLADLAPNEFAKSLSINIAGTFLCLKHEIAAMLQTGGGAIVNTSSCAGILAVHGGGDYNASKHAVIGLTKAAALDYAKQNIRVNAILPGVTLTPMVEASFAGDPKLIEWADAMQPIGRLARPEEIAEGALWLLSDAASFVTGISLPIDGGFSMI